MQSIYTCLFITDNGCVCFAPTPYSSVACFFSCRTNGSVFNLLGMKNTATPTHISFHLSLIQSLPLLQILGLWQNQRNIENQYSRQMQSWGVVNLQVLTGKQAIIMKFNADASEEGLFSSVCSVFYNTYHIIWRQITKINGNNTQNRQLKNLKNIL